MPLYDYACRNCDNVIELFHSMSIDRLDIYCVACKGEMVKLLNTGAPKRPDAPWVKCINGFVNDLEMVNSGRMKKVETREDARSYINHLYKDPYKEPKNKHEADANKRVGALRQRYLERF